MRGIDAFSAIFLCFHFDLFLFSFRFVLQRLLIRHAERCCDNFIRYARFIVCCVFIYIAVKRYLLFVQRLRDLIVIILLLFKQLLLKHVYMSLFIIHVLGGVNCTCYYINATGVRSFNIYWLYSTCVNM